ncbi:hypothetical protein LIER_09553 [Lithospermum erythrorhizon]|uniref:Protein kinase domain-containing protein n=1 Tax=Lithospermum erythrorhizon TaxID=34254 RepID=A0AAV3PG14_LITER
MADGGPPPLPEDGVKYPLIPAKEIVSKKSNPTTTSLSYSKAVQGHVVGSQNSEIHSEDPHSPVQKTISWHQGKPAIVFSSSEKKLLVDNLKFVLIGKFSHGRPSFTATRDFFASFCLKGSLNISNFDKNHIFLECSCKADFYKLWLKLIWSINGFPMRVFKWGPDFIPHKESAIAPVWIRIVGIPLYMFEESTLLSIAQTIGKPIRVDPRNLDRSVLNSARICVELYVSEPLMDSIWVCFEDETTGKLLDGFWLKVFYDVVPAYGSACYHIGHGLDKCKRGMFGVNVEEIRSTDQVFDHLSKLDIKCADKRFDNLPKPKSQGRDTDKGQIILQNSYNTLQDAESSSQTVKESLEEVLVSKAETIILLQEVHADNEGGNVADFQGPQQGAQVFEGTCCSTVAAGNEGQLLKHDAFDVYTRPSDPAVPDDKDPILPSYHVAPPPGEAEVRIVHVHHQDLNKKILIALIASSSILGLILLLLACFWIYRLNKLKKSKTNDNKQPSDAAKGLALSPFLNKLTSCKSSGRKGSVPAMDYQLLVAATNNLHKENVIGEGGLGRVYKAHFNGNLNAAVKMLHGKAQDIQREYQDEVDLLSKVRHQNVISLLGYCIHDEMCFLVYEMMQNGSLESHLHGPSKGRDLTWNLRMKIALDVARGLEYLHEHCNPPVIHRDIKASNILLDSNFNAKLSDFGLAITAGNSERGNIKVSGTMGYVAPEYILDGKLTDKSDVYAFGVVLLELLTGRRAIEKNAEEAESMSIVTWAMPQLKDRAKLPNILDPAIMNTMDLKHLYQVAAVAVLCVQPEPSYRPLITDVLHSFIPIVPVELGGSLKASDTMPPTGR